ncbi:MAG: ATP-dependent RecD-like DNA helicase [Lachnospiraceae bacterium]|nr:ATP-dependent RecD-like DNA helicase [Lachnospiraceae bacterium]
MERLEGYIDHFLYYNDSNGYGVFELDTEDDDIICVGTFPGLTQGETIEVSGEWTEHPTYGPQLKVAGWKVIEPSALIDVERYLASGAIKGVGPTIAKRIIKKFGKEALDIIETQPERLTEIKGISERIAQNIATQVIERRDLRDTVMLLTGYGISNNMAIRLYDIYGPSVDKIIRENPYRLADEVDGIGFKKADEIASKIGIAVDSKYRIHSGVQYVLGSASAEGHTFLPKEELLNRAYELLGIPVSQITEALPDMMIDKRIVVKKRVSDNGNETEEVYLSLMYYEELNCARMLHELSRVDYKSADNLMGLLDGIEAELDIELDELQRQAVYKALDNGVFILTGGPGTGKTTAINAMIKLFAASDMSIMLAAPTGRAAKRMTETTGYESKTIHRLLELSGPVVEGEGTGDRRARFERKEDNPLDTDVVIIDEASMVDIHLLYALLKAIMPGTRLILVGDDNQLPSVGPGQILHDLISSGRFAYVELKKIFRQAALSDIVVNAHKINNGEEIALDNKSKDFFFLERDNADVIYKHMIQLITQKLPSYVEADPMQIQVLTPTRIGALGVETLNRILQKYINPESKDKPEYTYGETIYRLGDKVMQIKNNYNLNWEIMSSYGIPADSGTGVFNGDIGVIIDINKGLQTLTVEYDDRRRVIYPLSGLDELELAYAVTIHKSQGSEYPAVIIPLLGGPRMLLNRNLLYTGVTRAKKCVTILGSRNTVNTMIHNINEKNRYTGLAARVGEIL